MKTIVSFSGGRTSAYMAHKIITERPELDVCFLFANTGKEWPETLDFVNECNKRWNLGVVWIEAIVNPEMGVGVTYKVVTYETASRGGEPFDAMVKKFGIPNKEFPHCTRELKERPMQKWAKANFGDDYTFAIGMRADEKTRATPKPKRIYPLVQWWPTWEIMVRSFWAGQPFDLQLKDYEGNCDLCWKKSLRKRMTLIHENPGIEKQWEEWENADDYVFDRDNLSIAQVRNAANGRFRKVKDKFELAQRAPELCGIDLDIESSCTCG